MHKIKNASIKACKMGENLETNADNPFKKCELTTTLMAQGTERKTISDSSAKND